MKTTVIAFAAMLVGVGALGIGCRSHDVSKEPDDVNEAIGTESSLAI